MNKAQQTIARIRKLPANRDKRFSPFIQEKFDRDKRVIIAYLSGNLKEVNYAQNDNYKVVILDNPEYTTLYIKQSNPHTPVPAGKWMDWWEEDHEKYFGVTEHKYNQLPIHIRANLEAKLQLTHWVEREYKTLYDEFYYPRKYDKMWFAK